MDNEADKFEIKLKILGKDLFGMEMSSKSNARNWAAFSLLALIVVALVAAKVVPMFTGA